MLNENLCEFLKTSLQLDLNLHLISKFLYKIKYKIKIKLFIISFVNFCLISMRSCDNLQTGMRRSPLSDRFGISRF